MGSVKQYAGPYWLDGKAQILVQVNQGIHAGAREAQAIRRARLAVERRGGEHSVDVRAQCARAARA